MTIPVALGRPPSIDEVLRAQLEPIRRKLHHMVDAADLDDVTQEVLVEVARSYASFRGDCAVGTWVYRITCRTAWAHLKRGRRVLPFAPLHERLSATTPSPEEAARAQDIHALVRRLSPPRRMVFLMHDLEGHTAGEIAEILGIPEGTVHSRLREARMTLRAALSEQREAP